MSRGWRRGKIGAETGGENPTAPADGLDVLRYPKQNACKPPGRVLAA